MNPVSSLRAYSTDVERFFDDQSSTIISNKDREHAAILISTLFKKAREEILVFSRHLDSDFYRREDIARELMMAVDRGVRVRILIQEVILHDTNQYKLITELKNAGVIINECKTGGRGGVSPINFTVVDCKAYRLERNRNTHEAFACANDPETAQRLIQLFQSFESEHEELEINRVE